MKRTTWLSLTVLLFAGRMWTGIPRPGVQGPRAVIRAEYDYGDDLLYLL